MSAPQRSSKSSASGSSSSAASAAAAASSPWQVDPASARSTRAEQLARLLGGLAKKADQPPPPPQPEEKERRHPSQGATLSSVARSDPVKRRPSSAPRSSPPPAGSRPPRTLPPPLDAHDPAATAYKAQLMDARGKRGAAAQAAAGATAIERGASVHARSDLHDVAMQAAAAGAAAAGAAAAALLARMNGQASPAVSPGPVAPDGFVVASGNSMEERAAMRAFRRQQIAEQHAAMEAARQAEIEARAQAELDAIEEVKRAEAARKRDAKRAERDAAAAKMRAAELESQKALLAALHHQRARLLFFGWAPWRRLLEAARIRSRAMARYSATNDAERFWRRWLAGMEVTRAQRAEREARKMEKAAKYYRRRCLRQLLRQWFRVVVKRTKDIAAKRIYHLRFTLRNAFIALRRTCFQLKQARSSKLRRLEPRIEDLASVVVRRHAFSMWRRAVEIGREAKMAVKKQQAVKEKVGGWLEEFRAQKARERGKLPSMDSATGSTTFAPLWVDPPASTSGAPSSALSPRSTFGGPISPSASRYSAQRHSSASPRGVTSPSSSASTSASRPFSYADFITSVSPRASSQATSAASALPARGSAFALSSLDDTTTRAPHVSTYSSLNSPTYRAIISPKNSHQSSHELYSSRSSSSVDRDATSSTSVSSAPASKSYFSPRLSSHVVAPPPAAGPALKPALSPTAHLGRTVPAGRATREPKPKPSSANANGGSNLSATSLLPTKQVTFGGGVGLTPATAATTTAHPRSSTRPSSAVASHAAQAPSPAAPSSNLSLIQAARAKAMELDAMDDSDHDTPLSGLNHAGGSHLFHLAFTQNRRPAINYESSLSDEESIDAFQQVLTTSYKPAATKSSRPASSPLKRADTSSNGRFLYGRDLMDSARSDLSTASVASLSSSAAGTWSSEHAHPSVSLAAARAARREQAARNYP